MCYISVGHRPDRFSTSLSLGGHADHPIQSQVEPDLGGDDRPLLHLGGNDPRGRPGRLGRLARPPVGPIAPDQRLRPTPGRGPLHEHTRTGRRFWPVAPEVPGRLQTGPILPRRYPRERTRGQGNRHGFGQFRMRFRAARVEFIDFAKQKKPFTNQLKYEWKISNRR